MDIPSTDDVVDGATRSGKRLRSAGTNGEGLEAGSRPLETIIDEKSKNTANDIVELSKELELEIAHAIFDVGLKVSSPKLLLALMPEVKSLSTEHIKSHLQKYRLHHNRNNQEFNDLFDQFISLHNGDVGIAVTSNNSEAMPMLSRSSSTNKFDDHSDSGSKYSQKKRSMQKLNEQAEELVSEWYSLHERILEIVKNIQE